MVDGVHFSYEVVCFFGGRFFAFVPIGGCCAFHDLEEEYGVVCGDGTPRLCNDVRVWESVLVASVDDGADGVVDILLDAVVHRAGTVGGARPVVVYAESTADVDKVYVAAEFRELDEELCGLLDGELDAPYFGYLASDVEMEEL